MEDVSLRSAASDAITAHAHLLACEAAADAADGANVYVSPEERTRLSDTAAAAATAMAHAQAVMQSVLAAPPLRSRALGALEGLLGDMMEELQGGAGVTYDDVGTGLQAARAGHVWARAAAAHRDAQAAIVAAWAAATRAWIAAAPSKSGGKRRGRE